ncbi:MAG: NAD(P)H-hydrate dehydratase [bacterium]|nr:NAD(P)H-hydrate dehydratase [bacterium]
MRFQEFKQLIRNGDVEQVRLALDANPDLLNARDLSPDAWEERTALHCAAGHAQLEIVKLLVERGAEVYSHPGSSYPAIFVAAQCRYFSDRPNAEPIIDYFLNEIPDKAEGTLATGATIHIAARLGFTEIVRRHLEMDPLAVHQRGRLGDTPLHWPCHNGHVEIVKMLLDAGAHIEADELNCYGGKPLHWASEHEPEVVRLLLERGARVDSENIRAESKFYGMTPLQMNALQREDCVEVTRLLLKAGADVHRKRDGQTALDIAQSQGNARIAAELSASMNRSAEVSSDRRLTRIRRPSGLMPRPEDGHKGTFGTACVVAGSRGMSGAACLAGQAALHSGAGLVTVATPVSVVEVVAASHPSLMTVPLAEQDGKACGESWKDLQKTLARADAVAVGPGLGQSFAVRALVHKLYSQLEVPVVLDADGLNAFSESAELLKIRNNNAPRVLTPHLGEFARLTGKTIPQITANRQELAVAYAEQWDVVLLLKGPGTIITDGTRLAINTTGNSALATGGSGDVLTGMIAALLAQGIEAFDAAYLAAHVHGLAGEVASQCNSLSYVTSVEILQGLNEAWKSVAAG